MKPRVGHNIGGPKYQAQQSVGRKDMGLTQNNWRNSEQSKPWEPKEPEELRTMETMGT